MTKDFYSRFGIEIKDKEAQARFMVRVNPKIFQWLEKRKCV